MQFTPHAAANLCWTHKQPSVHCTRGNLRKAMENIMCCDSDDEERFESLVRTAIAAKEVPALGTFAKSSKGAKVRGAAGLNAALEVR